MRSLTHFDICYSTKGLLYHREYVQTWEVAEPLPVSIVEVYLDLYTQRERWRGPSGSMLCQQCWKEREEGGWKKWKNYYLMWRSFHKNVFISVFYNCFLINMLYASNETHLSFICCFIFGWGVAFRARFIFGSTTANGFNLRGLYYCLGMPACYLQPPPPPGHACSSCSAVLMKDYLLVFSIRSGVRWRRRTEGEKH